MDLSQNNGQEEIPCEYDRVNYFYGIEINNSTYYVALAKKDSQYYLISKNNDRIPIKDYLEKKLQLMESYTNEPLRSLEEENYKIGYVYYFDVVWKNMINKQFRMNRQTLERNNKMHTIELKEKDFQYYYHNKNYSMLMEPISEEMDDDYDDSDGFLTEGTKYKVTVTKNNGEKETSILYLPGLYEEEATLDTFENGYICFETEDHTRKRVV